MWLILCVIKHSKEVMMMWAAVGRAVLMKGAAVEDLGVKGGLVAAGWLKCWGNRSVVIG